MPTYTYICSDCSRKSEFFFYIKDYKSTIQCPYCSSMNTARSYCDDISSIQGSIVKHDTELKTLGDLANRNRDKMSNDKKLELFEKHNKYKQTESNNNLPKGMSRIKKPQKPKWSN